MCRSDTVLSLYQYAFLDMLQLDNIIYDLHLYYLTSTFNHREKQVNKKEHAFELTDMFTSHTVSPHYQCALRGLTFPRVFSCP